MRDVCYDKVVALEAVSFLTVHVPAVAGGVRVGVGLTVELEALSLLHRPGPAGAAQLDTRGVPHLQQEGGGPPGPVRDVGGRAGEGLVVVSLLGPDEDDGGGVVPLAVLQYGVVRPHVLDDNPAVSVVPVNLY